MDKEKVKTEVKEEKVKKAKTSKKPNIFQRLGKKCKEIFSELKKVSWPSFGKVVKNTGVVIAVVVLFLVVITLVDFGMSFILKALV